MGAVENIILLVDDDKDDQLIIKEIFSVHSSRLTVLNVDNGEQALHTLDLLRSKNILPCLIILDMNMPKMDGRQTLLAIRKKEDFNDIPIVLFSTSSNPEDMNFARAHGSDYVVKPFSYEKMKVVVEGFIRRCRLSVHSGS
jgi:CheY-like chemotaxis protein